MTSVVNTRPLRNLGRGPAEYLVTTITQIAEKVKLLKLEASVPGEPVPFWKAGDHIQLPVIDGNGRMGTRCYSLVGDPDDLRQVWVAIQCEEDGSGGSVYIHENYRVGMTVRCPLPDGQFHLPGDARPIVFIAGGIGITPFYSMLKVCQRGKRQFDIHYCVRSMRHAPLMAEIIEIAQSHLHPYFTRQSGSSRPDFPGIIAGSAVDARYYLCGPTTMMREFEKIARNMGVLREDIIWEQFVADADDSRNRKLTVRLARSQTMVPVRANQSVLDALLAAGVVVDYGCKTGDCGACAVQVLEGVPEHRDHVLDPVERKTRKLMCVCVSRARSEVLTLDI